MKSLGIKFFTLYFIHLFFHQNIIQGNLIESAHYTGAVIEYHPITTGESAEDVAIANAENYVTMLKITKEINSDLDIAVFPETGLTTSGDGSDFRIEEIRKHIAPAASYIPSPSKKVSPCGRKNTKVTKALKIMSCAAKQYRTYLVVNYLEKEDCKQCAGDNLNFYNTNIVFDRSGTIIARYRKYNLYGEPGTNRTSKPELSTFNTDFGVKFGQFVCFDILFGSPALDLLRRYQITDIVYSTHWFSFLPFLDELQIQAAWSNAHDINVLAAGYNKPSSGSSGSGIFAGKDNILGTIRSETDKNVVLIAKIPKVINGRRNKVYNDTILYEFSNDEVSTITSDLSIQTNFRTEDLSEYTTRSIFPGQDQHFALTNKDYTCFFTYKANFNMTVLNSGENYYRYRFGIFDGSRSDGVVEGDAQTCGLISCKNDSLSSCGKRFDKNETFKYGVSFEQLEIIAFYVQAQNISGFHLPLTLKTDFQPLYPSEYSFRPLISAIDGFDFFTLSLNTPHDDLMTFGFLGRKFRI